MLKEGIENRDYLAHNQSKQFVNCWQYLYCSLFYQMKNVPIISASTSGSLFDNASWVMAHAYAGLI